MYEKLRIIKEIKKHLTLLLTHDEKRMFVKFNTHGRLNSIGTRTTVSKLLDAFEWMNCKKKEKNQNDNEGLYEGLLSAANYKTMWRAMTAKTLKVHIV